MKQDEQATDSLGALMTRVSPGLTNRYLLVDLSLVQPPISPLRVRRHSGLLVDSTCDRFAAVSPEQLPLAS